MWDGKGSVLYSMERYNEAIEAYDRAISLYPRFADAWCGRGEALSGLGDKYYEKALKDYDKAINLNPNMAYAWHGKGEVLKDLGRYEEAIEAFNKAIELDKEHSKPYLEEKNAIEILIEKKKAPNARTGEIKLGPECAEYYYKKAMKQRSCNLRRSRRRPIALHCAKARCSQVRQSGASRSPHGVLASAPAQGSGSKRICPSIIKT